MAHILDTPRYSLRQVATRADVNIATVWRWVGKGVRGRRLRTQYVGGRRFVLASDLDAFLGEGPSASVTAEAPHA